MNGQEKKNSRCSPAASHASPFPVSGQKRGLRTPVTSGRKCAASLTNSGPIMCLAKMLLTSSIWGSTKRSLTWQKRDMLFGHSYFLLVPSAHGMNASELLSWGLMFPTPLAADTGSRTRTERISISPNGGVPPEEAGREVLVGGAFGNNLFSDAGNRPVPALQPGMGGMADGLPTGVDGNILWCIEPTDIPRLSPNTKDRSKRLKTLGNAVVPAQVYPILKYIADMETGKCSEWCVWEKEVADHETV